MLGSSWKWRMLACGAVAVGGCRTSAFDQWQQGQRELEAGNLPAAIARLEQCRRLDPDYAPSYLALAAAYSKQGNFEAVAVNLDHYLELHPEHTVAHLYLAECMNTLGEPEAARRHYLEYVNRASVWGPTDRRRQLHSYVRLADLAERRRDEFEQNLYHGIVAYHRAQLAGTAETGTRASEGQSAAAEHEADAALIVQASHEAAAEPSRSECLAEAARRLRLALNQRPTSSVARSYLAETYRALGDEEVAIRLEQLRLPSISAVSTLPP